MIKFSLKTLLILVTITASGFGLWINGYQTAWREAAKIGPSMPRRYEEIDVEENELATKLEMTFEGETR